MIRRTAKTVFTFILLFYFVGFAVFPVSAIYPAARLELDNPEARDMLKRQDSRTDLFLFDLALWEVLKSGKRSDNSAAVLFADNEDAPEKDLNSKLRDGGLATDEITPRFSDSAEVPALTRLSIYSTARSAHSGLSPPFSA